MARGEAEAGRGGKAEGDVARLQYRMPWMIFTPTFILFFLLNYLAWFTTVNEDGTDLVMSPYVAAVQAERAQNLWVQDYPFDMRLFLEDTVLRGLFGVGQRLGGMDGIRVIWCLAWLAHCLELGIAFRICLACRATPAVFAAYCLLTVLGGVTQLVPLIEARDKYLSLQPPAPAAKKKRS
ncbi:uncharacterized protein Tco025E_02461 [Trypanosoma conorhini]|uniref:Uncharacterized protein n=1 Tax=Trypanosoma conorhini TaxID=83891 RepID=A0A422Q3F7_9TRYP|nr:uncharacterized protein Tco025E_02461 [Trypanosoma conorhini]RNF24490.1 hypothetical protein Tco025E_02461 [Trypanosoma conorhini]